MKKLIAYLTAAAIIFDFFTPLRLVFDGGKAMMMLIPTILIIFHDGLFFKKSFLPMALYVVGALITIRMGSMYFSIPFLLQVVYAYACFEHYLLTRDRFFVKVVTIALFTTLTIMLATSLPLFISMPNLSRLMLDAEENGIVSPIFYWTLSYDKIHSLPIYSILVFYLYRNSEKKIIRRLSLLFFAAIFVLMLFADSAGALLINVAIVGILLLYNQKKSIKVNAIKLSVLAVVMLLFMNQTVMSGFLTLVQPVFAGSHTYSKIELLKHGDTSGDIDQRSDLLDISLKSFQENPFLPTLEDESYSKIGGHNNFIDQIVALGLLLGIFFIWFMIERIKRPWIYLTFPTRPYYLVGVLAMLAMGFIKNFYLLFPACFILPMILIDVENPMVLKNKRLK